MIEPDDEPEIEDGPDLKGDWIDSKFGHDLLVWPGQQDFIFSEAFKAGIFTGAGYGKSQVLIHAALKHAAEQDGWWTHHPNAEADPLKILMGAPHNRYLVTRLIPGFAGLLSEYEQQAGRPLTKRTGRNKDGWFANQAERRRELDNGTSFYFYSLHEGGAAVAMDSIGLFVDEGTMLSNLDVWQRAQNRCRDPRGVSRKIRVVGTPEKGHFLYDDFYNNDVVKEGCEVFTAASLTNPLLDDNFFRTMADAGDFYIDMQVMGKWVKGAGGQRFAKVFDENTHLQPMNIPANHPGIKFDIGWDPGYASGQVVVMYFSAKRNCWYIVDEVVIQGFDTVEVCNRLKAKGYNRSNIRAIFMDPKDATKHKSNGPETDASLVYKHLGVRAKVTSVQGRNAVLRSRLDALSRMLSDKRLLISDKIRPRHTRSRGVVNAIRNFALEPSVEEGREVDIVTNETSREWKHSIDAIHYVLMNYEHEVYRRVLRNQTRKGKGDK